MEVKQPYFVRVELTASATSLTSSSPAEPVGDHDFVCTHIGIYAGQTAWTILFRDTGAGRDFMPNRVHVNSLVGSNWIPFELPAPWTFRAGTSIYVEAYNGSASSDTIYITFMGSRILK